MIKLGELTETQQDFITGLVDRGLFETPEEVIYSGFVYVDYEGLTKYVDTITSGNLPILETTGVESSNTVVGESATTKSPCSGCPNRGACGSVGSCD